MARILLKEKYPEYNNELFNSDNKVLWDGVDNFIFFNIPEHSIKFIFVVQKYGIREEFNSELVRTYGLGYLRVVLSPEKFTNPKFFFPDANNIFLETENSYFFGISYFCHFPIFYDTLCEKYESLIEPIIKQISNKRRGLDIILKTKKIIK